jgi:FkbM family methyltransferase
MNWAIRQSGDNLTRRLLTDRLNPAECRKKYIPVRLRCLDGPLLARPGSTDRLVIEEIFRDGEYEPILGWCFRSVLDCGANAGFFAAYAQSRAGDTLRRYVGVEPDPDAFELLTEIIRIRGLSDISTLLQVAVSAEDGTAAFDTAGESWGHRLSDQGDLQVQTLSVNSILDRASLAEVDLLKLDIEGGEKQVLESWPTWRRRVRCLVVELHDFWDPLDYDWFAACARASGFVPMPAGRLFGRLPGAIRDDVSSSILG